jgi:hypothetical protein
MPLERMGLFVSQDHFKFLVAVKFGVVNDIVEEREGGDIFGYLNISETPKTFTRIRFQKDYQRK